MKCTSVAITQSGGQSSVLLKVRLKIRTNLNNVASRSKIKTQHKTCGTQSILIT